MGSTYENMNQEEEFTTCLFAMQLASGSVLPMVLKSAIELDLLELIKKAGPGAFVSPSELAAQIPTTNSEAPVMLDRILRLLASYSILKCTLKKAAGGGSERLYALAPVCKFLTKNEDGVSMAPLLLMNHDKVLMESCYNTYIVEETEYRTESKPNNDVKVEETKDEKAEETKEAKTEEKKEEEAKPPAPCVLFVDLHCLGCAKKIERSISKIRGVEEVAINMAKNEVTIKGMVEPQAVCNNIINRTKRNAKVLSPLPEAAVPEAAEGEPIPQVVASQVSSVTTVELNVNMHCEACAQQLKRMILKMKGVITAETEFSSSKVTVTGTMDADQLVDYVYRRTKKQAKIVPQPEPEKPPEESPKSEEKKEEEKQGEEAKPDAPEKEKKDGDNAGETKEEVEEQMMQHRMMYQYNYQPVYVMERIPAPQLFSDENPNACSVM